MSEQSKRIKVKDRRMFTPDGDLREEYKDLKDAAAPKATAEPTSQPAESAPSREASAPGPAPGSGPAQRPSGPVAAAADEPEETASGAAFYDLVAMLAQSASVYLNQAAQNLEQRGELLEMSRMHIDLLSVLDKKTRGNLDSQEKAMLDDAIYRLRMAFVELGG